MRIDDSLKLFNLTVSTYSEDVFKKQYRILARKYHPDLNPDESAKHRFQEITSAYEYILKEMPAYLKNRTIKDNKASLNTDCFNNILKRYGAKSGGFASVRTRSSDCNMKTIPLVSFESPFRLKLKTGRLM